MREQNGKIVEPTDSKAVAAAILDIIIKTDKWNRYSCNGIKNILAYSWPSHCIRYLKTIQTHRDADSGSGGGGGGLTRVLTQSRLRHSIDDSLAALTDVEDIIDVRKTGDLAARMRVRLLRECMLCVLRDVRGVCCPSCVRCLVCDVAWGTCLVCGEGCVCCVTRAVCCGMAGGGAVLRSTSADWPCVGACSRGGVQCTVTL